MKRLEHFKSLWVLVILSIILAGCGGGGGGGPKGPGDSLHTINFEMPASYFDSNEYVHCTLPADKTVKFYTLTENTYNDIKNNPETTKYVADHIFTGTTGKTPLSFTLPSLLKGQKRYIYAVVELQGNYELEEKTDLEVWDDADDGIILFGQALNFMGSEEELVTLTNGVKIGNFGKYQRTS